MSQEIPSREPSGFAAGETVRWTKSVPDYSSADGWNLIYSFRGPTEITDVIATASGSEFSITLSAQATASLKAGTYRWGAYATKGSGSSLERYPVASGVMSVSLTLVGGDVYESHAAKTLRVIECAIEGRLTKDMESYSINGRAINKIPISKLYSLRAMYQTAVWRERNPGKAFPTKKVRFADC